MKYDKRHAGMYCSKECYNIQRTSKTYTYSGLHTWLWRNYRHLKHGICQLCERVDKRTEWANISKQYRKDINDYLELCKKCHDMYDNHKHDNNTGNKHTEETKKRIGISVSKNRWGNQNAG